MVSPEPLPKPLIPLNTPEADLQVVGGKGANLIRLVNAGFLVPAGFLIPTSVYRDFMVENNLDHWLQKVIQAFNPRSPESLSAASDKIRTRFEQSEVPKYLDSALEIAWGWLGGIPVAVRSSATAEDLPELSFAGQQDTVLNVVGRASLLNAVVQCWSSLWTARAIGYREHNHISHEEVALSVVVQIMVQSEASGVLFTANPLTGERSEAVIEATLGLGEGLVGGHVDPDHYIVDAQAFVIKDKSLGSKGTIFRGKSGGGVTIHEGDSSNHQAISDKAILELVEVGKEIETLFDCPQDIEWAWADSRIYILQSRPITSLFPIPQGVSRDPLEVFFSFGAVQGILDPMTPLGRDAIRFIFAGGASLFGFKVDQETQGVIKFAGERLWGNLTPIARHPVGARLITRVFPGIEPGSLQALEQILADPRMRTGTGRLRFKTIWRIGSFAVRILKRLLYFMRYPEGKAEQIQQRCQTRIGRLRDDVGKLSEGASSLKEILSLYRGEMYGAFVYVIPEIVPALMTGLLPLLLLNRFSKKLTGSGELALRITGGLPNNVTTEMDLRLWDTARAISLNAAVSDYIRNSSVQDLTSKYLKNSLPELPQQAVAKFLYQYGMRGPGEIDIGRPRWREDPGPILQTLQSYLQIEDESMAPDVVFNRSQEQADQAVKTLQNAAHGAIGGAIKAKVIQAAVRRVRALAGLRESPKFYIVQVMGIIRQALLVCGKELVDRGRLERYDDLFFLYFSELENYASGAVMDWKKLIDQRRAEYQREMRRKQVPRLLLSDGRVFYKGMAGDAEQGVLNGSPVSPGVVESSVRVVLDPRHGDLVPGEILVCPGTDPAWTPLFLPARGLIMEVGGLMTHGAIVAREYGIPAVVGVDRATERLKTGDKVRLDGNSGRIELI